MGAGPRAGPLGRGDVFEHSPFREQFLRHNRDTRDDQAARAILTAEWRYLGPLLAGREHLVVLDLACGSGPYTLAWTERKAAVVGLDFDRALLAGGRERWRVAHPDGGALREPAWTVGNATELPLPAAAFDVVFCNSLLEHVPDWRRVLAEMSRVLRPGGVAVIYTTNRYCPIQQEVNGFPFYSWLPGPLQRRVLDWIMAHRRDLVNWTDFPAIHWFSFPAMRRALSEVGLAGKDRIDLMAAHGASGLRGALTRAASRHPALKLPYYFYASSMAIYGVKGG